MESLLSNERAHIVLDVSVPEDVETARVLMETLPAKMVCAPSKIEAVPAFVESLPANMEAALVSDEGAREGVETVLAPEESGLPITESVLAHAEALLGPDSSGRESESSARAMMRSSPERVTSSRTTVEAFPARVERGLAKEGAVFVSVVGLLMEETGAPKTLRSPGRCVLATWKPRTSVIGCGPHGGLAQSVRATAS